MNKKDFQKIEKILKIIIAKAEEEAIEEGIDITSEDWENILKEIKEKTLSQFGLTLNHYEELKAHFKQKKPIEFKEIKDVPEIPDKAEIENIAKEVLSQLSSKIEIPAPKIINKIVKQVVREKPIFKTEIIKETERVIEPDKARIALIRKNLENVRELSERSMEEIAEIKKYVKELFPSDFKEQWKLLTQGGYADTLHRHIQQRRGYGGIDENTARKLIESYNLVPTTRTLEMVGTTNQVSVSPTGAQDLSANRTWTFSLPQDINTGATPTFANLILSTRTANRVAYFTTGGAFTDSANFTFDGSQLVLAVQGSTGGILIGGDVQLYRESANLLTIPDAVNIALSGSASSPSLRLNSTNTGLYSAGTDQLGVAVGGNETLRINSQASWGWHGTTPTTSEVHKASYTSTSGPLGTFMNFAFTYSPSFIGASQVTVLLFTGKSTTTTRVLAVDVTAELAGTNPATQASVFLANPKITTAVSSGTRTLVGFDFNPTAGATMTGGTVNMYGLRIPAAPSGYSGSGGTLNYYAIYSNHGHVVLNDNAGDYDVRIESQNNANMFFLDASENKIAIGQSSASAMLDVLEDVRARQLIADGDNSGVASTISLTNATDTNGVNAGSINQRSGGTTSSNVGWIKIYVGTTARYIPVWD